MLMEDQLPYQDIGSSHYAKSYKKPVRAANLQWQSSIVLGYASTYLSYR